MPEGVNAFECGSEAPALAVSGSGDGCSISLCFGCQKRKFCFRTQRLQLPLNVGFNGWMRIAHRRQIRVRGCNQVR